MIHLQTVFGFFGNAAEAQQAVQHLLAQGFTRKTVELLTLSGLHKPISELVAKPNSSSGRFLNALFGSRTEVPFRRVATITVQSQSDSEASQVANLLYAAGAEDVIVEERLK